MVYIFTFLPHLAWVLPILGGLIHGAYASGPLLPVDDPFYIPPSGFESKSPGTILRHRAPPYPISAFGIAKANIYASWQILYRTTNSFGEAIATVSTIVIPHNANFSQVLSYQVAQDSSDPNCAPSYAYQLNSTTDGAIGLIMPQLELVLMSAALDKGWVVTVPDHEGTKGAFLANNLAGHATLDNIRAALASTAFTNISSDAAVAMWGYSGGSEASGFAAELQPSYAPELAKNIVGAALGGTVPRILPVINTVNKGFFAGLIAAGVNGLAAEYPSIVNLIDEYIIPSKKANFTQAQNMCLTGALLTYANQDVYTYVNDSNIFTSPAATKVLNENALGRYVPETPLFIYKSVNDEISPVNDTDALVSQYCSEGARVEYKRDTLSEHGLLEVTGAPDAFIWLNERMNGVAVPAGCTNTTILTSLTDPGAIEGLGAGIVDILLYFLSLPVGPFSIG